MEGMESSSSQRIDPSQFMLSADNRKMSAPVLSAHQQQQKELMEEHMSRSHEVENIPERLQHPPPVESR